MSGKILGKEERDINYKKWFRYFTIFFVLFFFFILNYSKLEEFLGSNNAFINNFEKPSEEDPNIRKPFVAGLFYSSDKKSLDKTVLHYLKISETTDLKPKILIVPHAGYEYSGSVAGRAYSLIRNYSDEIRRVFLIGPSHYVNIKDFAVPSHKYFQTPLGKVEIDIKIVNDLLKNNKNFKTFDSAHRKEHSIEVQLPFLQKTLKNFKIIPIVYGDMFPEQLAKSIEPYMSDSKNLFIFSADLSHYNDYKTAKKLDEYTNHLIVNNNPDIEGHLSCGAEGINTALILSKKYNLLPKTVNLKNSGDIIKDKESVVGYGAWSFTEAGAKGVSQGIDREIIALNDFADVYEDELRSIVKISLENAVDKKGVYKPSRKDYSDDLFSKGASFVTLKKNGELRGCVGTIVADKSIAQDVANSAFSAAMSDSRFRQLNKSELQDISFKISILTSLERVRYSNEEGLINNLEQNIDGLLLIDGERKALFLPSVWEDFSDKKQFIKELKIKAGISPAYWSNKIKIYKFKTREIEGHGN